jgi:hypothetical protein
MPRVIAVAVSRTGGRCQQCGRSIPPGGKVIKQDVGERGPQTAGKNGRGRWVCERCAYGPEAA